MGSTKDVMELFAERDIRQHFSHYNGWSVAPVSGLRPGASVYRLTKGKWNGIEEAFVAVSFSKTPGEEVAGILDQLPGDTRTKVKKYLLTPQATDTSAVPPHIRILLMNAFAFSGADLLWLTRKKNAQVFGRESSGQPAAT